MNVTQTEVYVGQVQDFLMQIGRVVVVGDTELAIFRTSDDTLYAVENSSPHPKGGPLAEGIVSGYYLYDPLHDWKIDLRSGEVQAPDRGTAVTYPVIVEGDRVKVCLRHQAIPVELK
ncbi:nitrite reductase small subunit NirD [Paenibacillus donghaensis]|uniref:Nitrite reductase (NAD(P)H) small subunit n=1 Tax=Paenibacillus donghaensis TaxID=414771 RepID=A0A2Z2KPF2_9BACL|nr:nitrite reductase small subunit NirD [Paenibacillus donghaensis]ASA23182.1 nitrite reductase (NAD(P)H) small subunit [Paenibacillus donghaensis]